jgi:hypothetical protein
MCQFIAATMQSAILNIEHTVRRMRFILFIAAASILVRDPTGRWAIAVMV